MRFESRSLFFALIVAFLSVSVRTVLADDELAYVLRDMDDLRHLVAPIALYPDALLAEVLAATTYPDDVIAAAKWEDAGNNLQSIDAQPWDSSVRGVAHYPAILHYLANNSNWMNDLGDAFLNQRANVMTAVQNLRGEALAAGTLTSTPQQTVINEDGYIQIIPTNPDILYPPIYDPQVVYVPAPYVVGEVYTPCITFGPPVNVGVWLDFDLDWYDHGIYRGRWGRDRPWWHEHDRDHDRRDVVIRHYIDDRPGIYRPGRFNDRDGRPIEAQADHWARDEHKPAPRVINRPAPRPTNERPERGYPPPAAKETNRPAPTPRGSETSRESARGRDSRQHAAQPPPPAAAPKPAPAAPEPRPAPQSPAPAPQQRPAAPAPAPRPAPAPARSAPARSGSRQSTPPPEARPSAPVRGGAMGGYQNGSSASHSSDRGAASRGKR